MRKEYDFSKAKRANQVPHLVKLQAEHKTQSEILQQLYIEAKNFRKAFLIINRDDFRFGVFKHYPSNCCEYTSLLLAKYLIECRIYKDIFMIYGENKYKKSIRHAWLRINDIDIDITAYQFSSTSKTVIVEYFSEWHQRYNILKIELPNIDFVDFKKHSNEWLLNDYHRVLKNISCINELKNSKGL